MPRPITLSEKHGVNPSIIQCFFCLESKGIALCGRLPGDKEAPREVCVDKEPCDKCKKHMESGVMMISVRDGESGDNPYRTGNMAVVSDDGFRRVFHGAAADAALRARVCFIPDSVWKQLGLPTKETLEGN